MFNRAVTVFKKTEDGCERHIIRDVFYDDVKSLSIESKGEAEACSIKVVIPLKNVPDDIELVEGDYLCKGELSADYADFTSLNQSEATYLIVSCDKRDYGNSPHYLLVGR